MTAHAHCFKCGCDVIRGHWASEYYCDDCRRAKQQRERWEREVNNKNGYRVLYCPNNEYPKGARFSRVEVDEMKHQPGALIPGMIMHTNRYGFIVDDKGHLRRLDEQA